MAIPKSAKTELEKLGYLGPGGNEGHALKRFQRRAMTQTRMIKGGGGLCATPTYVGPPTGKLDQSTWDEIQVWLRNGWVAPLGVWGLGKVTGGGTLREDVAQAWNNLINRIQTLGGTIAGPYGDTKRPLMKKIKVGASKFSFHYAGRAIDLNQALANPGKLQRYFIVQDPSGSDTYWRLYCKTDDQTGQQGTQMAKGHVTCYRFGDGASYKIPEGYYIDLTAEIERGGLFERIAAQSGWGPSGSAYNKSEWWHFQYRPDKEESFQDEVELIGVTEKQLRDIGYTDADLDHPPG
jgi:hypothetical protein